MKGPPLELLKTACPGYIAHWTFIEHGRATIAVARYHDYKGDKTFRQFTNHAGLWTAGLPSLPYPLYGLESLDQKSSFDSIFICEGERKANLLHQLGWPAVSIMLGAENTAKTDFMPLKYFSHFTILRDNDAAGIDFATAVSAIITRMHANRKIFVCNLCPNKPAGDVIDWVASTPLYGSGWNGFETFNLSQVERVRSALEAKIQESMIPIEECKDIAYKPSLALFPDEPKLLIQKLKPVQPFPILSLESNVGSYVSILARQKSLPVDLAATTFLTLIAGVLGRKIQIRMKPEQNWMESANVWAALVAPPAFKKSPSLRELFSHVNLLESRAEEEYKKKHAVWKANSNPKSKSNNQNNTDEPCLRRYVTDDCTTAKLRELFSSNPGGLIFRNDELKGMLKKLDAVGHESDRGFYLQCWSGLDYFNEDRIGRGSTLKIPLTLTWIGCIPPSNLSFYLNQAVSEGGGSDGLMQRFQMPCYPDFTEPFENSDEIVSQAMQELMNRLFLQIDSEASEKPRLLSFSIEAQKEFDQWLVKSENDARFGGHLSYWESHLGKIPKLVGSLCITLHRIKEFIRDYHSQEVSKETFYDVLELVEYYKSHARRCYESLESIEMATARKILTLVKNRKLDERFKACEIYGNGIGGLTNSRQVRDALYLLQELGWAVLDKSSSFNGRPTEDWIIHPNVRQKDSF